MYCFFCMMLHDVVERRWREPPFLAAARCFYVHILLLVMAGIFTSALNKTNRKCDHDITKQIHVVIIL